MLRSHFEILSADSAVQLGVEHCLVLRDLDSGGMTVTNDVDNVVRHLIDTGKLYGQRLFYIDSDQELDEIKYSEKGYIEFGPFRRETGLTDNERQVEAQKLIFRQFFDLLANFRAKYGRDALRWYDKDGNWHEELDRLDTAAQNHQPVRWGHATVLPRA